MSERIHAPRPAVTVVFVLVRHDCDDHEILGVFRSAEAAQASQPTATWDEEGYGTLPDVRGGASYALTIAARGLQG